jgi:LAO/AO transport system kinase
MIAIEPILSGDRLALSRLLSQIEADTPSGRQALNGLFPHTGSAHLVGVTGSPGTGKSSLVNRLAFHYRHPPAGAAPMQVAVVAVDPSSPFTGGAIMGDRVRMRDLAGDPGVFIRSMASRGSLGGLANATAAMVQAFDAAGYEVILIETVGAGQAEVDIARLAHTTLVVEAPGLGDDIQAIKAGILEIADILVINKADHPGVEITERALRGMLNLAHPTERIFQHHGTLEKIQSYQRKQDPAAPLWIPPIQRTIALEGDGIPELYDLIAQHRTHLESSGLLHLKERTRLQAELDNLLHETLVSRWREKVNPETYQELLERLLAREISPWKAVEWLLNGGEP